MTRDQNLVGRAAGQVVLSICQVPVFQRRVDTNFVRAVLERQHLVVRKAKSPVLLVVGRPIRDPVRIFRKREEMRLEFAERHGCMHRNTVVHDVQVALLEVDNPPSARVLYIGVSNIPFLRYGPIEDLGSCRHFTELQRYPVLDQGQSAADAVTGDASANGVKSLREVVQFLSDLRTAFLVEFF